MYICMHYSRHYITGPFDYRSLRPVTLQVPFDFSRKLSTVIPILPCYMKSGGHLTSQNGGCENLVWIMIQRSVADPVVEFSAPAEISLQGLLNNYYWTVSLLLVPYIYSSNKLWPLVACYRPTIFKLKLKPFFTMRHPINRNISNETGKIHSWTLRMGNPQNR